MNRWYRLAFVPRRAVELVGELLLSAGFLILLYMVYSLWFTNVAAQQATVVSADRFLEQVQAQIEHASEPSPEPVPSSEPAETSPTAEEASTPTDKPAPFVPVEPFALLYIPRLQSDVWAEPLVEGIYYRALASGVGHYPTTEMPGAVGNFAMAGHRATNGEPFARFERLQAGDKVYVQSLEGWFEYELVKDKIVQEDEVWVLADTPKDQGFAPGSRLITLTTCDPRWNSYQRWVWWGELTATYPLDEAPIKVDR